VVQSFDWRALVEVERLRPEFFTGFTTVEQDWSDTLQRGQPGASPWLGGLDLDDGPTTPAAAVRHLGGSVWQPFYQDLRPADLDEAHRLGLRVVVWTVNDPGVMRSLIEAGVDGIITDYPDRLRRVMGEAGLPVPPAYP
jgi:glycerophosphoryl diester phosphodiesterase